MGPDDSKHVLERIVGSVQYCCPTVSLLNAIA